MSNRFLDPGMSSETSQSVNLSLVVFTAIFCLSPLFVLTVEHRFISDDAVNVENLIEGVGRGHYSHIASLLIILIPAADLFLDFPFRNSSSQRPVKSSKVSDKNSAIFRLNDIERLLFIIGVAIQSSVWFCPLNTDISTLALVYDTTTNASVLLVLGPILTYLQRSTTTFTTFWASVLAISTTFGFTLFTAGGLFQYECSGRRALVFLGWGVEGLSMFVYFSLIGTCAVKYLHLNLRTSLKREAFFALLINLFRRPGIECEQRNENIYEVYSNYIPALHMLASAVFIIAYFCIKLLDGYDHTIVYESGTYILIASEVLILVIELRIRKNEVARALVR